VSRFIGRLLSRQGGTIQLDLSTNHLARPHTMAQFHSSSMALVETTLVQCSYQKTIPRRRRRKRARSSSASMGYCCNSCMSNKQRLSSLASTTTTALIVLLTTLCSDTSVVEGLLLNPIKVNLRNEPHTVLSAAARTVISGSNSSNRNEKNNQRVASKLRKQKMKPMPLTGYDAKAIEEYYDVRPLQVGWRLNSLGLPLLAWYGRLLIDKAFGVLDKPSVQRQRGKELREAFVRSKSVALIKSGQALSLRPDLIKNKIWAEELGKLVDAVGSFSDVEAMKIIQSELKNDILPRLQKTKDLWMDESFKKRQRAPGMTQLQRMTARDPILSLFDFDNSNLAVASASIGQVYKAKIRSGPQLEAAIGKEMATIWGGKMVAIKVQRPDVTSSASLDMYLLRRTALWLSKIRAGNIVGIADQFGMQLFGELDYIREANNCQRFRALYGEWDNIRVPDTCLPLTRKRVLVQEWVDGDKGPWPGGEGIKMVRIGLKCSVDQLMTTGLFHAGKVPAMVIFVFPIVSCCCF
jgi:hypothetical protein